MKLRSIHCFKTETYKIRCLVLLTTLEGLANLIFLLGLPKSASNEWLFGYSPSRIAIILALFLVNLMLIWFTINLLRKPTWEKKLQVLLKDLAANTRLSNLVLTILSAGFSIAVFFLILWAVTKDNYYQGYLLRFGPVLIFGALVIVQMIAMLLSQIPKEPRAEWMWSFLFVSILLLLWEWPLIVSNKLSNVFLVSAILFSTFYAQMLFRSTVKMPIKRQIGWVIAVIAIGLFLYTQLFFIPKKFLIYRQSFFVFSPVILLGLFVSQQLTEQFFSAVYKNVTIRTLLYLAILAGFIYAGNLYYLAGKAHSEQVNTTYAPYDDEEAYMGFAIKASQTNFKYTGVRNQMPVYPYIQALFYDPNMSLEDFFARGKQVNIFLSLASLVLIFLIAQKFLSLHQAINLTLVAAFGLYVFKSGYFMVELLYYALSALAYVLLCLMLIKPSAKLAVAAGVVLGVGHLTKASILPALLLFIGVFAAKELFAAYRRLKNGPSIIENEQPNFKVRLTSLLLVVICFFAVVSPYITESKRVYGVYFYNIGSTFYMWYDSYEEAIDKTMAHGESYHWPDMPPEDIPSPRKYFREHNLSQIWDRIEYGIHWQTENIRYQYGFFNYPIFFLIFSIVLFSIDLKRNLQIAKKYFPLVAFAVLYFFSYISLYIWYSPISCLPRFIYALYVPLLLTIFVVAKKSASEISFPLIKLTNFAVFLMILIDIWYIVSQGPFFHDFGS